MAQLPLIRQNQVGNAHIDGATPGVEPSMSQKGSLMLRKKYGDPRSNFPYRMEGVDPLTNGLYRVIL